MEFKHVPEPYLAEISNYLRQRGGQVYMLQSLQEVRAELLRHVTDAIQPIDLYPGGRALLGDEPYLTILRDMLNLSQVLDDMEQTGVIPYANRGHYYNVYKRLYNMLGQRAKAVLGSIPVPVLLQPANA